MASWRKIVPGVLVLLLGVVLWQVMSGSDGDGIATSGMEGLTLQAPDAPDDVEQAPPGELPELSMERESAEPDAAEPELATAPVQAKVVEDGIFGRVYRRDGEPVPGRTVELSLQGAVGGTVFGSATTGEDGTYALSFPMRGLGRELSRSRLATYEDWSDWAKAAREAGDEMALQALVHNQRTVATSTWLEVSVSDANGFSATKRVDIRSNMPDKVRVDLLLEPRRDLEGQILGPKGPVPGANIMLFDREWILRRTVLSGADGRFKMNGPPPGAFVLHARLPGVGAGQSGGNFIGGALRAPFQTIELGGGMKLTGKVVNPNGEALPALPLVAIIDSLAQSAENPLWPLPRELAQAEALGALCFSETETRGDGGFAFTAMEAGYYQLRFGDLPEKYQPEGLFSTMESHEVVFAGCLLDIELKGSPENLVGLRVHCVELKVRNGKQKHFANVPSFGYARFLLEPGSSWELYAEREGRVQATTRVSIKEGDYLTERTMRIGSWRSKGREQIYPGPPITGTTVLKVILKGAEGTGYRGLATLRRVEGSGDGLVLEREPIPAEGIEGLERGQYQLAVEAEPGSPPFLPTGYEGRMSLGTTSEKKVTLAAKPGGAIRLKVNAADDSELTGVTAHLVPAAEDGAIVPLTFALEGNAPTSPILPMGKQAHCSPVVPAGKYTLTIRGVGSKAAFPLRAIELEAGEILSISVDAP